MRKLFILSIIILLPSLGFSQQMRDAVHLKNGGLVYGTIIEIIPDETIKIQTADGSIFVYRMDEIEKITKEAIQNSKSSVPKDIIKKGYKGFFNLGKGFGGNDLPEFNTSHGIQYSSYLYFGAGFGIFSVDNDHSFFMPMFNIRTHFREKNITPFIDLKLGWDLIGEVGLFMNPSFGLRIGGNIVAFNASITYKYMLIKNEDPEKGNYSKNNVGFMLGFEF